MVNAVSGASDNETDCGCAVEVSEVVWSGEPAVGSLKGTDIYAGERGRCSLGG